MFLSTVTSVSNCLIYRRWSKEKLTEEKLQTVMQHWKDQPEEVLSGKPLPDEPDLTFV